MVQIFQVDAMIQIVIQGTLRDIFESVMYTILS